MGTALSVFRATPRAPNGTTRELSGADGAGTTGIDKDLLSQTGAGDTQAATQTTGQQSQQPQKEQLPKCFLEGESADWQPWVPTRIKESRLTPEERAKFQGHLDLIFNDDTIMGRRIAFCPDDMAEVMVKVREYLKSEPMLIDDVPFDITVVGDLHGQLYDLDRVFRIEERDGKPGWENMKYLFLGNYVDKGRQSTEIVMALFCLKMLYPDRIFLLRGNHEFMPAKNNYEGGFLDEFVVRYDDVKTGALLYEIVHDTFCYLSIAAIIGNVYLCVHAGISNAGFTRQQMRGLTKPLIRWTEDVLVHDILHSEPARGLRGTAPNFDQKSFYFGHDALCHALYCMDVDIVIRGHTKQLAGYDIVWASLFSIFTATAIDGKNDGSVAVINAEGKIGIRILKADPERTAWEKFLWEGEHEETAVGGGDGNAAGKVTHIEA